MRAVFVGTLFDAQITQLIVGCLAAGQGVIGVDAYLFLDIIVVGAVVGDVQTSVAVDEGQVTIAVETAGMACTQGDEVAVVDVVNRGRGVAKHRSGVGIDSGRTRRRVTAGKHGIVDDDALVVQRFPPVIGILVLQGVQCVGGNILTWGIDTLRNGEAVIGNDIAICIQAC